MASRRTSAVDQFIVGEARISGRLSGTVYHRPLQRATRLLLIVIIIVFIFPIVIIFVELVKDIWIAFPIQILDNRCNIISFFFHLPYEISMTREFVYVPLARSRTVCASGRA